MGTGVLFFRLFLGWCFALLLHMEDGSMWHSWGGRSCVLFRLFMLRLFDTLGGGRYVIGAVVWPRRLRLVRARKRRAVTKKKRTPGWLLENSFLLGGNPSVLGRERKERKDRDKCITTCSKYLSALYNKGYQNSQDSL